MLSTLLCWSKSEFSYTRDELAVGDDAAEVLTRFGAVGEQLGVTRLADVTGLDNLGLPVVLAIRPLARSLTVSVGKGLDKTAARAAALMEAIESWHAEHPRLPVRRLPWSPEGDESIVDPRTLPRPLGRSVDFTEAGDTDWVPGTDLLSQSTSWVPLPAVSLDFVGADSSRCPVARNSNGLASGASRNRAIVHAVCEVIERDAEWRWRSSDVSGRVDLDSIANPEWHWLRARLEAAGVTVAVWNVTSDVGVPCFGCVIVPDENHTPWRAIGAHDGFACHPDPGRALVGAVLEAAQKRLTYISGSRDDLSCEELARAANLELTEAVRAEIEVESADISFGEVHSLATGTLAGDRDVLLGVLQDSGCRQIVLVDLERAELGVAVVKVVVPGMYGPFGLCGEPLLSRRPRGT